MTEWLSPEEQRAWRGLVLTTQLLDAALDRQLQRDAGINHAHYGILVVLSEADAGRLRMGDLAARLGYSASRLTHAVSGLERRGWVRREPCADDRRGLIAVLTADGRQALERAAPGHVAEVRRRVFDRLTPEQVTALAEACEALLVSGPPEPPGRGSGGSGGSGDGRERSGGAGRQHGSAVVRRS